MRSLTIKEIMAIIAQKLVRTVRRLTIIFTVIGLLTVCFVYEVIRMEPNRADIFVMYDTVHQICSLKPAAEQKTCSNEVYMNYLPCFSPISSPVERKACFQQALTNVCGKFVPELSRANMPPEKIIEWVTRLTAVFLPVDLKVIQARNYVSPAGWNGIYSNVYDMLMTYENVSGAKVVEAIMQGDIDATLKLESPPEMKDRSVVNGVYTWIVRVPMEIEFNEHGAVPDPQAIPAIHQVIVLKIVRSLRPDDKEGITIASWDSSPVIELDNYQRHVSRFGSIEKH
jgi:hypothetical protein